MTPEQLAKSGTEHGLVIEDSIPVMGKGVGDIYNPVRNKFRKSRIEAGLCRDCGKVPPLEGTSVCLSCRDKRGRTNKLHRVNRKEKGICVRCGKLHNRGKILCELCSNIQIEEMRVRRKENKKFLYDYFGGKCNDCGETDIRVMSLDHINNDGSLDKVSENGKRQISPTWYAKLCKLIKSGKKLPRDLQMLCFNCHAKKDLTLWWYDES